MLGKYCRERQRKLLLEAVGPQGVGLFRMKTCITYLLKSDQFAEGTFSQIIYLLSLEINLRSASKVTHARAHLPCQLLTECKWSELSSKLHTGLYQMAFPMLRSSCHLLWPALKPKCFDSEVKVCEFLLCKTSF